MAVMNMAEEMVVVWKHVFMMYAPSLRSVPFFGSLPHARHRDCRDTRLCAYISSPRLAARALHFLSQQPLQAIAAAGSGVLSTQAAASFPTWARGKKMPPARAATEGMAGASSASAMTRLYVRPSVVLPNSDTMLYAMRLPSPDLMKPLDSQKAMAISHLHKADGLRQFPTGLTGTAPSLPDQQQNRMHGHAHSHSDTHGISVEKALKAWGKVSVLVSIAAPRPRKATAPSGSGVVMMDTMVPTKTASRCQACSVTPAGAGRNQMSAPMPTEMPSVFMSAPHLNSFCWGAGTAPAAAEAHTCERAWRWGDEALALLRRHMVHVHDLACTQADGPNDVIYRQDFHLQMPAAA
jgi:hypothetical protein